MLLKVTQQPSIWIGGAGSFARCFLLTFSVLLGQALGQAQSVKVGEVAEDFEITNRETGDPLKLSDYDGHIVVLDFFAWWCGPCRFSSPDLEKNVGQFFHDSDGNEHGVPVTVIGVNIEEENPDRTDQFVKDAGLGPVGDDLNGVAWKQFRDNGSIPLFVIINGVSGNSDYEQWEVLYKHVGYEGAEKFRDIINKVKSGFPAPEIAKALEDQSVELGDTAIFEVEAKDDTKLTYQWFYNGRKLSSATESKLVLFNIQAQSQGTYSVIITNEHELKATDSAELTSSNVAPSILNQPRKVTVEVGKDAEIAVDFMGAKPMTYQWFFDGKPIDGAVTSTLFLDDVTLESSGDYHVKISNEYGSATSGMTKLMVVNTLQEALDNGDFAFDSGPEEVWVLDNQTHTDEEDSARSPNIENDQSTWVEMEVKGPGTVYFKWRTTNDTGQEFICYLNDKEVSRFNKANRWDKPRWLTGAVRLGEGDHVIRWEYSKQFSFAQNMYGWLDDVRFLTEEEVVEDALLALGLETDVPLEFGGDGIWMVEPSKALDEEGGLVSADILGGGSGWVEATLKGPGYLEFHHKSLNQFSWWNPLQVSVDDEILDERELRYATDQLGWSRGVVMIPKGAHKVRWVIDKTERDNGDVMLDWVDYIPMVDSEPEIDLQPKAVETEAPGFAVFEVEARGYPFPAYQWYRDGEPLAGEVNRVLEMNSVWGEDAGGISVVVSNALGEVESDIVDLVVSETIDEDLADAIDYEGKVISIFIDEELKPWKRFTLKSTDGEDSARVFSSSREWFSEQIFAVRLEGPGYLTFKWRLEAGRAPEEFEEFILACTMDEEYGDNPESELVVHSDAKTSSQAKWIDNWAVIPEGVHTIYFTFLKDSDQLGRAFVDQVAFEAAKEGKPESVEISATKDKIRLGESFEVGLNKAIGFPIPTLQWKFNGEAIKDATNRVYRVDRAWDYDAGKYTVVATNKHGSMESEPLEIEVEDAGEKLAEALDVEGLLFATGGDRKWSLSKVSDAEDGDAAKVSATSTFQESWLMTQVEGPGVMEFQWKVRSPDKEDLLTFLIDGEVAGSLPGDTDWDWAKFVIPEGRHTLEWSFSRVSWASGSHMAYVDALEFYVPEDSAPEFVEQPFDVDLEGLGSAEFNVEVDGWPFPEFQWYLNGEPIKGETSDTLFFDSVWPEDVGEIWVVAKNKHGELKSEVVNLTLDLEVDKELADALDAETLSFLGTPDFEWVAQTDESSDGEDALLMTGLPDFGGDLQYAVLKTRVEGPGEFSFQAKIAGDLQIFRAFIGEGTVWGRDFVTIRDKAIDWTEHKIDIPEGRHTVSFMFLQGPKNGGGDSSLWLDEVKFKSSEKPNPQTELMLGAVSEGKLTFQFEAVPGRTYQLQRSTDLVTWELDREVKPEQTKASLDVEIDPASRARFYRIKSE